MSAKKKEPAITLVTMTKDGQELQVHPDCVAAHERGGWVVVEPEPAQDTEPADV